MQNDMRDRLIELLQEYTDNNNGGGSNHGRADHLIANGVIVPPCKVGQTVYVLFPDPRYNWGNEEISILESNVYGFHYCNGNDGTVELRDSKHHIKWDIDSFGVSIFLTKAQAEQKLKELRENG